MYQSHGWYGVYFVHFRNPACSGDSTLTSRSVEMMRPLQWIRILPINLPQRNLTNRYQQMTIFHFQQEIHLIRFLCCAAVWVSMWKLRGGVECFLQIYIKRFRTGMGSSRQMLGCCYNHDGIQICTASEVGGSRWKKIGGLLVDGTEDGFVRIKG